MTDESSTVELISENDFKVFTSPDYPSNYPHNTNLTFTVYSPEGTIVKLVLLDIEVEVDVEYVCNDQIDIYDGKS